MLSLDPFDFLLGAKHVQRSWSLQCQVVSLHQLLALWIAAANHRRLYPLLLLQVVSDAYSPAFLCPLSFGDNSSLLVRGGAAFLPPLSAYKITWWFMRSCCVILIQV